VPRPRNHCCRVSAPDLGRSVNSPRCHSSDSYSPLGRGILTGRIKSRTDLEEGDFRLIDPRYSTENFHKNIEIVEKLKVFADRHSATTGQVALAWLLAQGDNIVTIPGYVLNITSSNGDLPVRVP